MSHCIEWRRDRRHIVLPICIVRPAPSDLTAYSGTALLDTGATATGITARVARHLDLTPRGKRLLGSARGEEQVQRYLFRVGLTPDRDPDEPPAFPFLFEDVEGFELRDNFRLDVLLGMDVLSQCDFQMDRRGRCRLAFG